MNYSPVAESTSLLKRMPRRSFLAAASAFALAPVRRLAAAVKPVRIIAVDVFPVEIPVPEAELLPGMMNRYLVSRISTDAGISGYTFVSPAIDLLDSEIRPALVGQDLFAVERHLKAGLIGWVGLEHAIWDAIGKIAGRPVYQLLGGGKRRLKVYLTTVWPGGSDQAHVSYGEQAEIAVKFQRAGFRAMKIRAWRPRPLDDVEACRVIRAAVGESFEVLFDRTAHAPESVGQAVWDYRTGLNVARGMQREGAYWLEEPFARDDFESHARLAREVDIPITGGEGYIGLNDFHQAVRAGSYDILQPECRRSGGIWICRKVGVLAEAFGLRCVLHGTMGLKLAGALHASSAVGAEWQEFVTVVPPSLPQELWAPGAKLLKRSEIFKIENGEIEIPDLPGIGLDVDEDALERYRNDSIRVNPG